MAAASTIELYEACRDGDMPTVQRLLPITSIKDLNCPDADGRTCLHIASMNGRREIIPLLLERGALRQTRDKNNKTPGDVAKDEEVLECFARPEEKVIERYAVDESGNDKINWLFGQDKAEAFSRAIYRGCIQDRGVRKTVEKIEKARFMSDIDESKEGKILRYFLNEARERNDSTFLVRAYTIDGIFYSTINCYMASGKSKEVYEKLCHKWSGYYAGCVMKSSEFESYRFSGVTYRGMVIDREAFNQYIVGVVITNKAFQSSSKLTTVALKFSQQRRPTLGKVSVLIQHTIIDRRSALDISTLSEFPDEQEVLMVPGILFRVEYVDRIREPYPIHLRQLSWSG